MTILVFFFKYPVGGLQCAYDPKTFSGGLWDDFRKITHVCKIWVLFMPVFGGNLQNKAPTNIKAGQKKREKRDFHYKPGGLAGRSSVRDRRF